MWSVRAVDASRPLADRRGSRVVIEGDGEPCVATIDPRRVERILVNLVVNAIEHGEGRPVTVRLGHSAEAVAVAVEDRGVGLREGETELVFNRFWRADPARARTSGGTGLGLAIALEDARLHGGWLQAWGRPGSGSVFRLTLPREPDVTLAASPLPLGPTSTARQRRLGVRADPAFGRAARSRARRSPRCAGPMADRRRRTPAAGPSSGGGAWSR